MILCDIFILAKNPSVDAIILANIGTQYWKGLLGSSRSLPPVAAIPSYNPVHNFITLHLQIRSVLHPTAPIANLFQNFTLL